jgi:two-component system, cell cycle sensor histidine kinase and response regulator CckA
MQGRGSAAGVKQRLNGEDAVFRAAFETAGHGIALILPSGDILECNEACARMLGYVPAALQQLEIRSIVHPNDRVRAMTQFRQLLDRKTQSVQAEMRLLHKQGHVVCTQLNATLIRGPAGRPLYFLWQLQNNTQRKRVEGALNKKQELLQLLQEALESVSQGIAIAEASSPDHQVVYVNPAFERMTGYSRAECLSRNSHFLEELASDPDALSRMRADLPAGRRFQGELAFRRKDGSPFLGEICVSPVCAESGRLTHFVSVIEDITARRNLEAQLRQALKLEAVGKLTGGVAHDFNNLLLIAHGNLELLNDALEAGESNLGEFVGRAQQAVLRGAELTRRLLAFTRLQPLKAFAIDLNELVSELAPLMSRTLGEDIQVETALQEGLATVTVDRSQVENALLNLAVNARDAMPRGGRLTIATRNISMGDAPPAELPAQDQDYVCLSVSDNGAGMPPEVRERAFEPFFTTKAAGKGTGLGLSMVYGFARQAGGSALLASEPGQGTTVSIYLPATKA